MAEYWRLWKRLNIEYEEYARGVGLTYSSMLTLSILYDQPDGCMQKTICEESFLPKQTVNQIITSFYRQGLVKLIEVESDRRYKTIRLTDEGLKYANSMIPKIKDAENRAMESLSESQRSALLESTRVFISRFHDCLGLKTN
jgi:DNA-binding MarR family transcriptional regulator